VQVTPRTSLALLAVLLAGVAGCGGSGSSDTTTSAAPATTSTPGGGGTAGKPDHFTQAQWAQYQKDAAAFKQQNTATLTRVAACAKPVTSGAHQKALAACVGDSLETLFTATTELGRTLAGFAGTVSGQCESSLNDLIGYVVPYQASIKALENDVAQNNPTTTYASVANLQTARTGGQAKAKAVEQNCAPA
jgi:hypothetical protein